MSENLQVGEGTLVNAAERVSGARADVTQRCNQLATDIQGMAAQWRGQGGTAFQNLQNQWQERQRIVLDALGDLENALRGTQSTTTAADEAEAAAYVSKFPALDA
ncbi:WXG100 family type VII secretion target [Nocardioides zeae]|uniref:ESAT-6-like protein n=1 Tax=Nocardioides imazamoxiresistens TaxID=3231893 RepID=A0ABU3PXF0_9ACTN|nr:WXG100 family type VII secretion target [Nocardioides zeae]MDT9593445.1 WXG100 family type VII secretion target [Nocardioides zeae]